MGEEDILGAVDNYSTYTHTHIYTQLTRSLAHSAGNKLGQVSDGVDQGHATVHSSIEQQWAGYVQAKTTASEKAHTGERESASTKKERQGTQRWLGQYTA